MFWRRFKGLLGRGPTPRLKQFGDLTPGDFGVHPVWIQCHTADYDEPWYDQTDEETFRPWTGVLPAGPEEGMLLVRAKLTLADGRSFDGFCAPQHEDEPLHLGTIQPQLFLPSAERCDFWDGMFKRTDEDRLRVYQGLGESNPAKVFPIRFAADPGLATGHVAGSIPGFCWMPKDEVKVYH
jgi:hypothetical protein